MKKIKYYFLISLLALGFLGSTSNLVLAATCDSECLAGTSCPSTHGSGKGDCDSGKVCCKKNPTGTNTSNTGFGFGQEVKDLATQSGYNPDNQPTLDERISNFISIFLSLLGVIFLGLMIYGGYNWMTAAGDEQKVDKAKDTIRNGIIGLVIVIAAYAISVFVITRLWGVSAT